MRTNGNFGAATPANLNVVDTSKPGAGVWSDLLTGTATYNGSWGAITALAAAVVTVVTTTIKTTNGVPATTAAGSFVVGQTYTIQTVGSTNFILIGASANQPGVVFTATGAGSGSGTASTEEQTVSSVPIPVGTTIYGEFKQITPASGTLLAYHQ